MKRRCALLLAGATAVLVTAAGGAVGAGTRQSPSGATLPARVVAIIPTRPARVALLDARTLAPVRSGWSMTLRSWIRGNPAVLSPLGSRVAVAPGAEGDQSVLIIDATSGRTVRQAREAYVEELYWLRGEGTSRGSPALLLRATLACSGGGTAGGVCGDDVTSVLNPGASSIYNGFYVATALRNAVVLAEPDSPKAVVVAPGPGTLVSNYVELSRLPESAPYQIVSDILEDRLFVITSTGQIARISRASTSKPLVDYHQVGLNGANFAAAWAGNGRIALWGKDGLGVIDTRTWTTRASAAGVTHALPTRHGIAAWTSGLNGLAVYRSGGGRRLHLLKGRKITSATALGVYMYVDTAAGTRYAIDLRTGSTVGPLKTRAQIVTPTYVTIP